MPADCTRPLWLNYSQLSAAIPGGVMAFNLAGEALYCDKQAERFVGSRCGELFGCTLGDLSQTKSGARIARQHLARVIQGEKATFDFCFRGSGTEGHWARITLSPAMNGEFCVGAVGILSDTSGERRAEVKLRAAELRLHRVAAHIPGLIYDLRYTPPLGLRVEYVSDAVKTYTGLDAELLMVAKTPLSKLLHPDDLPIVVAKATEAAKTLKPTSVEFRLLDGDKVHHMYTVASVATLDTGEYSLTGVAIDIGDRKRTETELRATQAQLRAVFDNFPFECWTLGMGGRFVLQNALSKQRWGELRGKSLKELDQPEEVISDWEIDIQSVMSGEVARRELTLNDGERRSHFTRISVPIRDGDEVLGVLGISIDTTEQRHLEDQLLQSQKLDAIGRLAGGIAHDFNNVLTAIMSCVRLLERRLGDPPRPELQIISEGANRAADLTRQLLAFAKQEMVEPRHTRIDALVLQSDRLLRRLIGEDVELVTLANARGWQAMVDPVRFEQAVINLVVNSRDAMPKGGKITVISDRLVLKDAIACLDGSIPPGEYLLVRVSDTGPGMTPATKARAFEPFFTTRQESGGTGLGLSSVYGSVHQAGGYVTLASEVGFGTSVTLYLPRTKQELDEEDNSIEVSAIMPGGSETILVVEDEPMVMTVATESLEISGYKVLQAHSPQAALALSRSHEGVIDLLLTDVIMPLGSGPELASTLRKERPGIAVLFMSGYGSARVDLTLDLKEVFFLPKPFTPEGLNEHVRKVIEARKFPA